MRCRPDDLAVVIRSEGWGTAGEVSKRLIGCIVRVKFLTSPSTSSCYAEQVWRFEKEVIIELDDRKFIVDGCADDLLQPIRPQSDEVVNQMVERVGKPNEVTA